MFREQLVSQWVQQCAELEVPCSSKFDMPTIMGDPMEIQNWNMNMLPTDSVSICNAIIVKYGQRKPLMIDPQLQGTKWIKAHFGATDNDHPNKVNLHIIRFGHKDMLKKIELCIKNGLSLMIEDMGETTEPSMEPILLNQQFKNAQGRELIKLGD